MALALGRTVEELNRTLSPSEWLSWMAYYALEPFGSPVEDERFRTLCLQTIAPHMKAGTTLPVFFDRDPKPADAEDDIITFFVGLGTVEADPSP